MLQQVYLVRGQLLPAERRGTLRAEIKFISVLIDRIELGADLDGGAVRSGIFVAVINIVAPFVRPIVGCVSGRVVIA